MADYNFHKIEENVTLHLILKIGKSLKFFEGDILDARYDYDFTNIDDTGKIFYRGEEVYERLCGWKRLAFNVLNKYEDNIWLGSSNVNGEWPVAYHGTNLDGLRGICSDGFDIVKLKRFLYGKGHFTTPFMSIAEKFAQETKVNGSRIVFIIQSRVNPRKIIKRNDNKYWILPNNQDLRPYGICFKILNQN